MKQVAISRNRIELKFKVSKEIASVLHLRANKPISLKHYIFFYKVTRSITFF